MQRNAIFDGNLSEERRRSQWVRWPTSRTRRAGSICKTFECRQALRKIEWKQYHSFTPRTWKLRVWNFLLPKTSGKRPFDANPQSSILSLKSSSLNCRFVTTQRNYPLRWLYMSNCVWTKENKPLKTMKLKRNHEIKILTLVAWPLVSDHLPQTTT